MKRESGRAGENSLFVSCHDLGDLISYLRAAEFKRTNKSLLLYNSSFLFLVAMASNLIAMASI